MQPIDVKAIDLEEPSNWFTDMKNHTVTKSNLKGQKSVSNEVAALEKRHQTESKCQEKKAANKSDRKVYAAFTDLEADLETPNRCPLPPLSFNDYDLSVVKETPVNGSSVANALSVPDNDYEPFIVKETPIKETCPITLESVSDDEFSNSTIIQTKFHDQQLPHSFSSPCSTSTSECMNGFVTPRKEHISHNRSPLYSSVNSHAHKRRKSSASVLVKMEQCGSPNLKTPTEVMKFGVPRSCTLDRSDISSITSGDVMKKDLRISCSLCRNSLGLEENNHIISSSLMSLSKVHLTSLWKGKLEEPAEGLTSIPVVVTDITLVDRRIWERSPEGSIGQGIWSKEDGCVYNTIFCTGCSNQDNCLGLHVVATDSSNVQFLNKVLLYSNKLEMQHIDSLTNKELSPSCATSGTETTGQHPFDKFAYVPQETNSSGWRSTKSRMRLPKKAQSSTTKY